MLTSNDGLHHMAAHKIRAQLRKDAVLTAKIERLRPLPRGVVFCFLHPLPINVRRDPACVQHDPNLEQALVRAGRGLPVTFGRAARAAGLALVTVLPSRNGVPEVLESRDRRVR